MMQKITPTFTDKSVIYLVAHLIFRVLSLIYAAIHELKKNPSALDNR